MRLQGSADRKGRSRGRCDGKIARLATPPAPLASGSVGAQFSNNIIETVVVYNAPEPASAAATDPLRKDYLTSRRKDVLAQLEASIPEGLCLELGILHQPHEVRPAHRYHNPQKRLNLASLREAFRCGDCRLLLIGDGGAGKTTALLRLAADLALEAELDLEQPVPFIVNLDRFQFTGTSEETDHRLEEWTVSQMAQFGPLSEAVAREWLEGRKIAVLFDGLDQVGDSRRADLVRRLHQFLHRRPSIGVVIACRPDEYHELRASPDTRLQLNSCVQLATLSDVQARSYVEKANATALAKALEEDSALRDLTRTPLELSMLVRTFNGASIGGLEEVCTGSLSERRDALFRAFVPRMLQRHARRERGVLDDGFAEHEIPVRDYRYDPANVNRWLEWLAATLSARERTSFASSQLGSLVMSCEGADLRVNVVARCVTVAVALALCLLAVAAVIVPATASSWTTAGAIIAVACILVAFTTARRQNIRLLASVNVPAWVLVVCLGCSAGSYALVSATGMGSQFAPFVSMAIASCLALLAVIATREDIDGVFFWTLVAPPAALGSVWLLHASHLVERPWILLVMFAVGAPLAILLLMGKTLIDFLALGLSCIFAVALGAIALLAATIGDESWIVTLVALAAAGVLVLGRPLKGMPYLMIAAVITLLAGAAKGAAVAVALVAAFSLAAWPLRRILRLEETRIAAALDHAFLTPCVSAALAFAGRYPLGRKRFESFAVEAVLLRRSGEEIEFAHRQLREHFALRPWMANLGAGYGARLKAIEALGYLGESALSTLRDFTTSDDPRLRAAAVRGLGHMPSPQALRLLAHQIEDVDGAVRQALVSSLWLRGARALEMLADIHPLEDGSDLDGLFVHEQTIPPECWDRVKSFALRAGNSGREVLERHLRAPEPWRRLRAARLLSASTRLEAETALIEQLQREPDAEVRATIVVLLHDSLRPAARAAIARCRNDKSRRVRAMAGLKIWEH